MINTNYNFTPAISQRTFKLEDSDMVIDHYENHQIWHALKDEIEQTRDYFYNFECSLLIPIGENDLTKVDFNKITNDFKNIENEKEFIKFTGKLQEVQVVPDKEVSDRSLIKVTVELIKDRVFTNSHYEHEDVIGQLRRKLLSSDELKIINNSCVEEVLDVLLPDELLSNICDVKGDFDNSEFFDAYNTVDKMIEQFGKLPTDICRSYAKDAAASCWSVINKVKGRRRFETIPASDLIDFGIATKFKKVA